MRLRALVLAAILATSQPAAAQRADGSIDGWYLVDGGAVPFLWAPAIGAIIIDQTVSPRPTPLWFDPDEGGATSQRDREVPGWVISVGTVIYGAAIALEGDESRWYHVKGFAESIVTTSFATKLLKATFGRHRPDRDPVANTPDGHRSFPSGHASESAAAATYFGLYLREHVFDRWRRPGTVTWWEVLAYAGLGAIAAGASAERVAHDRHHVSDAVAGSLLGAGTAAAIFLYQERRFDRAEAAGLEPIDGPQLVLGWSF